MTGLGAGAFSDLFPPIFLPALRISSQSNNYSANVVVILKNYLFTQ